MYLKDSLKVKIISVVIITVLIIAGSSSLFSPKNLQVTYNIDRVEKPFFDATSLYMNALIPLKNKGLPQDVVDSIPSPQGYTYNKSITINKSNTNDNFANNSQVPFTKSKIRAGDNNQSGSGATVAFSGKRGANLISQNTGFTVSSMPKNSFTNNKPYLAPNDGDPGGDPIGGLLGGTNDPGDDPEGDPLPLTTDFVFLSFLAMIYFSTKILNRKNDYKQHNQR